MASSSDNEGKAPVCRLTGYQILFTHLI